MPASSLVVALDSPAAPSVEARKLVKRWLLGLSLECGATLDAPAGLGRLRVTSLFPVTASPARIDGATRITVEHAAEAPPAPPHASAPPAYAAPPPPPPPAALAGGDAAGSLAAAWRYATWSVAQGRAAALAAAPQLSLLVGPAGGGKTYAVLAAAGLANASLVLRAALPAADDCDVGLAEAVAAVAAEFDRLARAVRGRGAARGLAVVVLDALDEACGADDRVAAAVTCGLRRLRAATAGRCAVVAATARAAGPLGNAGRALFDQEIAVVAPCAAVRRAVLVAWRRGVDGATAAPAASATAGADAATAIATATATAAAAATDADLAALADAALGYTPADLVRVCRTAKRLCYPAAPSAAGLRAAVELVPPSALRPNAGAVSAGGGAAASAAAAASSDMDLAAAWRGIAGCEDAKQALTRAVEWPRRRRKALARLGLPPPRGVLLYGPPGCAKTALVRAAAASARAAFVPVSAADVYGPYVGEAEANVRAAFAAARASRPALLFFDEVDALVGGARSGAGRGGSSDVEARVLATFLTEMDGVDNTDGGVLVVAATNRPFALDDALLRPGRFDRHVYVGPPTPADAETMLRDAAVKTPTAPGIDYAELARSAAADMTGAEIAGACREAAVLALREAMAGGADGNTVVATVTEAHLRAALGGVRPVLLRTDVMVELEKFRRGRAERPGAAQ